jgi:membrane dipeptidase
MVKVVGVDHVGIGSDLDGDIRPARGLDDSSKMPALLEGLRQRGYSESDIRKIAGENFLRVLEANERAASLKP